MTFFVLRPIGSRSRCALILCIFPPFSWYVLNETWSCGIMKYRITVVHVKTHSVSFSLMPLRYWTCLHTPNGEYQIKLKHNHMHWLVSWQDRGKNEEEIWELIIWNSVRLCWMQSHVWHTFGIFLISLLSDQTNQIFCWTPTVQHPPGTNIRNN